jgi:hypothetical protein
MRCPNGFESHARVRFRSVVLIQILFRDMLILLLGTFFLAPSTRRGQCQVPLPMQLQRSFTSDTYLRTAHSSVPHFLQHCGSTLVRTGSTRTTLHAPRRTYYHRTSMTTRGGLIRTMLIGLASIQFSRGKQIID